MVVRNQEEEKLAKGCNLGLHCKCILYSIKSSSSSSRETGLEKSGDILQVWFIQAGQTAASSPGRQILLLTPA